MWNEPGLYNGRCRTRRMTELSRVVGTALGAFVCVFAPGMAWL
jgi:hypothetical protein